MKRLLCLWPLSFVCLACFHFWGFLFCLSVISNSLWHWFRLQANQWRSRTPFTLHASHLSFNAIKTNVCHPKAAFVFWFLSLEFLRHLQTPFTPIFKWISPMRFPSFNQYSLLHKEPHYDVWNFIFLHFSYFKIAEALSDSKGMICHQ